MFDGVDSSKIYTDEAVLSDRFCKYGFGNIALYIDETTGLTCIDIRAKVSALVAQHNVGVVFIDHMQLIKPHTRSKTDSSNWDEIPRELKRIAKAYKVHIVLANQLNSEGMKAARPMMHHAKWAGKEDADMMVFLFRKHHQQDADRDQLEYLIRKDRGGRVGTIYVNYNLTTGKQGQCDEQIPTPDDAPAEKNPEEPEF
jgi:replicative DNA helicase